MPPELEEKMRQAEGLLLHVEFLRGVPVSAPNLTVEVIKQLLVQTYSLGIREGLRRARECLPEEITTFNKYYREGFNDVLEVIGTALSRKEEEITKV